MTRHQTQYLVHSTAEVSELASIGRGVKIWDSSSVREGVVIGDGSIIGKGVYLDVDIVIGANCKIQNGSYIYRGSRLEDGVFIGPGVYLTNDCIPRAITPEGRLKTLSDWNPGEILVKYGASIGAGSVVLPNVTIGTFAMVGAGTVVVRDVPAHGLVVGVGSKLVGYVCSCGRRLKNREKGWACVRCGLFISKDAPCSCLQADEFNPRSGSSSSLNS